MILSDKPVKTINCIARIQLLIKISGKKILIKIKREYSVTFSQNVTKTKK